MTVKRFSISIEDELAKRFEEYIAARGFAKRSEAIRELIEKAIEAEKTPAVEGRVVAALTFIFDHGKHLNHKLVHEQHCFAEEIVGITLTHLDERRSFEVVLIRSTVERAREFAGRILGSRGVSAGELTVYADE